ncbi:hypothetical protein [Actinomadura montaniterrae]|uniref:Uncharacterized protein n=1 Tax=Actinomadura montaniterrae TaxID=1803903 RepID=A0A6L3VXN0_9ACTN|nr:hypothetical protein [Actinomadura montaniterrae]KAB2379951.1 hypothetical protein F9B16_18810 [Actinomadura montaniterrae]
MDTPLARAQAGLGALLHRLDLYDLDVRLKIDGLLVSNPFADGCCDDTPEPSDTITCRPRPDDGDRFWFAHSWGEWIAEVDHVADAALLIATRLCACGPDHSAGPSRSHRLPATSKNTATRP